MALRLNSCCDEIEVFFHHKVLSVGEMWNVGFFDIDGPRRCSTTVIKVNGVEQSQGTIVCHPNDNFSKALGRQKSLTKALCGFRREIRKDVWDKYGSEIGFA